MSQQKAVCSNPLIESSTSELNPVTGLGLMAGRILREQSAEVESLSEEEPAEARRRPIDDERQAARRRQRHGFRQMRLCGR